MKSALAVDECTDIEYLVEFTVYIWWRLTPQQP
jgi:hypothetical protein